MIWAPFMLSVESPPTSMPAPEDDAVFAVRTAPSFRLTVQRVLVSMPLLLQPATATPVIVRVLPESMWMPAPPMLPSLVIRPPEVILVSLVFHLPSESLTVPSYVIVLFWLDLMVSFAFSFKQMLSEYHPADLSAMAMV